MQDLGSDLGVTWCRVQERDQRLWTPEGGAVSTRLRFTYSAEGPSTSSCSRASPAPSGTRRRRRAARHGRWIDDIKGDTTNLLDAGWSMVGAELSPEDGSVP